MGGETNIVKPNGSYPQLCSHPVGQMITGIYRDRIGMFYAGGQYEKNNLQAYVLNRRNIVATSDRT